MTEQDDKPKKITTTVEELRGEEPPEKVAAPENNGSSRSPYILGAALLWQDRRALPLLLLILLAPTLIASLLSFNSSDSLALLTFAKRALNIGFLYLVTSRWISRFSAGGIRANSKSLILLTAIGFAFWIITEYPVVLFANRPSGADHAIVLLLLAPALVIALRYYLYFFPITLNVRSFRELLRMSQWYTDRDKWLAVKVSISPIAIATILLALLYLIYPESDTVVYAICKALTTDVYWVLSTYLALGFAFAMADRERWTDLGLSTELFDQLDQLQDTAPKLLSKTLMPKNGFKILIGSLMIAMIGQALVISTPPTAKFDLQDVTVDENSVRIVLGVTDNEGGFRKLDPFAFTVADEQGSSIASGRAPTEVLANGAEFLFGQRLADVADGTALDLEIKFHSERSKRGLEALEGVYLWYWNHKLFEVKLSSDSS